MKNFILSIQHLLAMFGATVLVPILTGFDPSVAIFCAGLGTLIFHLCTKGKVPVFLGSSFAFIPVVISANQISNGDKAFAQGGIIVAGLIYVLLSFVIKFIGIDKIKKYFPPQVTGAMIAVIGLNLIPSALNMAVENVVIALITLVTSILINVFGKGFLKQLGILIAVGFGYLLSLISGGVDISSITNASLFQIPNFTLPKFSLEATIIIAPIVIAVFMEHVGDMTTNGTVVGKNFIEDPGLNKTLLGDGLATVVSGFIGGPANTTYGENTAVLAITKNYNPSLLRYTAIYAILLSFIGVFGGFLQSIPSAVMGGISIMLFSMISYIGIRTIRDSKSFKSIKNLIVIIAIILIGIGTSYLSNKGISIGIPITPNVSITGLSLAAIVGLILNRILNHKEFKSLK
ncbi:uracil-xanthine permease family protein [Candidatus Arthromitus sp. SFB-rat-Yit]|uniref:uracil-xanthine permease family protein n=1 Tax=Candidatus Arthromitus sp. SFB-rat-Yit TaxID=1041504 RepID=UPI000227A06C|nr:uracil-xanthine permease family protein [Candidatus Arthromitus sp. SFB-rat-Yit]BAK81207.1 uracil permease [Candidatus Arthromitus sp. SFB-rat-Yit]